MKFLLKSNHYLILISTVEGIKNNYKGVKDVVV